MFKEDQILDDEMLPKNHRTCYAKVTLYLEVPSEYNEETLEDKIYEVLEKEHMYNTSFADIIMSKPGSDDFRKYKEPVGFLAPDGKFYLIESSENGLAHLKLAPMVYSIYEDQINERLLNSCSSGIEFALERVGFIKVHGFDVHGLAHYHACWSEEEKESDYTPDPTQAQINALVEYIKVHGYKNEVCINGKHVKASTLKQADKYAIRRMFEL